MIGTELRPMRKSKSKDARQPFWLLEPCPEWCSGGHEDGDMVGDRTHWSDWDVKMTPSLHGVERGEVQGRMFEDPPELGVFLYQGYRETSATITVEVNQKHSIMLTVGEALELAKALTTAADIAEGHATGGAS